jgi:hypothetical protein
MTISKAQWCVIIMRDIHTADEASVISDPIAVFGPYDQAAASALATRFNDAPVPAGLEHRHRAIVRPMNDIVW